ncbi:MAG: glutamate racemase [Paludibacteraceae bacterium]|nr:glutamate racemase [Paludibacteraceae bacterium]
MVENHLSSAPIGVFDSGYGGLTILNEMKKKLPEYDFIYLGDNARTPYGTRSFDVVYEYTLQCVEYLFRQGCRLVILACNTASAKALRSIQQIDLKKWTPEHRVLGVIRPTVEVVADLTQSRHVGLLGTIGTVQSQSYPLEINKLYPDIVVTATACPMWVPLIENQEYNSLGADYFVQKYVDELFSKDDKIDTVILGCTHYPLLADKISKVLPKGVMLVSQGEYVAESLKKYLMRHTELDAYCSKNAKIRYLTTENEERFAQSASIFLQEKVRAERILLK